MRNRISVSTLDQYQWFLKSDEMSEQEFINQIITQTPPTTNMAQGTAWHSVLENWHGKTDNNRYYQDGFCFDLSTLASDEPIIIGEPYEREQKQCWYGVDGVELVGKFDVITPFAVIDHKLSANFDPERYFDSWQWRCYLAMAGKPKMIYQVFEYDRLNELNDDECIYINNYHRLEVLAYKGMVDEVHDIVADFNTLLLKYGVTNGKCK